MYQLVVHSTGGEVESEPQELTEDELEELRAGLIAMVPFKYLQIDTKNGFVVIPGEQILYVEVRIVEEELF